MNLNKELLIPSLNKFNFYEIITIFPEIGLILKLIKLYSSETADIYYESKITEAVSLIVDKIKELDVYHRDMYQKEVSEHDIEKLRIVVSYINNHYSDNNGLEQLARIACMGISKLKYTFQKVYYCNITQYIQRQRIYKAEQMLMNTNLAIKEIAQNVGYAHAGRFSVLFKRYMGLSPRDYRKLLYHKN